MNPKEVASVVVSNTRREGKAGSWTLLSSTLPGPCEKELMEDQLVYVGETSVGYGRDLLAQNDGSAAFLRGVKDEKG